MLRKVLQFILVIISCIMIAYVIMHRQTYNYGTSDAKVYVAKTNNTFKLIKNGKPFYIKGASGSSHIKELAEINGNTLRVYDTTNLALKLDEALTYGLAVVVDIPLIRNGSGNSFYKSKTNQNELKETVKKFVESYKDHPALLMWNLGNEITYPLSFKDNQFVKTFNDLIDIIHKTDPNHPVSTSVSGTSHSQTLGLHLNSPQLDVIAFNAFTNIKDIKDVMFRISLITNSKPYYISEWGTRGPWDQKLNIWKSLLELNSTEKSDEYKYYYETYIKNDPDCLGSLAFYWGHKIEGTPTWFNIFDEDGNKSPTYYTLAELWNENSTIDAPIKETPDILINGIYSENHIFNSKDILNVDLDSLSSPHSIETINWRLYRESWGTLDWNSNNITEFLDPTFVDSTHASFTFSAPIEKGVYRLFVYLYDDQQNYVTSNTLFQIFNSETTLN